MDFFSDLSLKKKFFMLFGVSVVFIAGIIGVGVTQMLQMRASAVELFQKSAVESQNLLKIRAGIEEARRALLQMGLERDGAGREAALKAVREATARVDEGIAVLQGQRLDRQAAQDLWTLRSTWGYFKNTREAEIVPRLLAGESKEALALALNLQEQRFKEMSALSGGLIARSNDKARELQLTISSEFQSAIVFYAVICVAGFSVAVLLISIVSRDIGGRFARVIEGMKRFRSGEGVVRVDVVGMDEVGSLADAMNTLFEQVHEHRIAQDQYIDIINWEKSEKEKKSAELQRSNEMFKSLVETTSDWVWEIDENGVYTYASPRVTDILGYEPEEVVGRTPFDFIVGTEVERLKGVFREHVSKGRPLVNIENANVRKDGQTVILETSGTPFFDRDGRLKGYRGIDRDITARRKAEEERAAIAGHLTQSEKLASIGQLAAGVAHEVNNPLAYVRSNLNAISGYMNSLNGLVGLHEELSEAAFRGDLEGMIDMREEIGRLKKDTDFEFAMKDARGLLDDTQDGVERISSIVKGLRDFSHAGGGQRVVHDLNECITGALKICAQEIKDKGLVAIDLCDGLHVSCTPQHLTQVFLNMIVNAAQAIGDNGRITIKTYCVNGSAMAEIGDNGPGMSEETRKRVFDPFFTTKPVGKGTGLGLFIAYNLVKEHGGSIDVDSAPGKGARFRVKLKSASVASSAA